MGNCRRHQKYRRCHRRDHTVDVACCRHRDFCSRELWTKVLGIRKPVVVVITITKISDAISIEIGKVEARQKGAIILRRYHRHQCQDRIGHQVRLHQDRSDEDLLCLTIIAAVLDTIAVSVDCGELSYTTRISRFNAS